MNHYNNLINHLPHLRRRVAEHGDQDDAQGEPYAAHVIPHRPRRRLAAARLAHLLALAVYVGEAGLSGDRGGLTERTLLNRLF